MQTLSKPDEHYGRETLVGRPDANPKETRSVAKVAPPGATEGHLTSKPGSSPKQTRRTSEAKPKQTHSKHNSNPIQTRSKPDANPKQTRSKLDPYLIQTRSKPNTNQSKPDTNVSRLWLSALTLSLSIQKIKRASRSLLRQVPKTVISFETVVKIEKIKF